MGNVGLLKNERFGLILANINRNVLLEDMSIYANHLISGGVLLMSGFYNDDLDIILQSAMDSGLTPDKKTIKNDWLAVRFIKSKQTVAK